jgi:hypothetical protein
MLATEELAMNDCPESLEQAVLRLHELARAARRNAAPVLATRLHAYARAAHRTSAHGWDGLVAARATLAEDLHRYEAVVPGSPLTALTRDALAVVSRTAA